MALVPAKSSPSSSVETVTPLAGTPPDCLDFVSYLARRHAISGDLLSAFNPTAPAASGTKLRELWELTELTANDFADEVASFFKLPRVNLQQILAAKSLAGRGSAPVDIPGP